jgi:4-aminobutyrate aminotransferase-like enzyme
LSCAAAVAVLDIVSEPGFLEAAQALGASIRTRLEDIAARRPEIGDVRGLGPMLAFEFAERNPDRAKAVVAEAFDRGLILLSCGLDGNVIRLLPPLTISDAELDEGFAILEGALAAGD